MTARPINFVRDRNETILITVVNGIEQTSTFNNDELIRSILLFYKFNFSRIYRALFNFVHSKNAKMNKILNETETEKFHNRICLEPPCLSISFTGPRFSRNE